MYLNCTLVILDKLGIHTSNFFAKSQHSQMSKQIGQVSMSLTMATTWDSHRQIGGCTDYMTELHTFSRTVIRVRSTVSSSSCWLRRAFCSCEQTAKMQWVGINNGEGAWHTINCLNMAPCSWMRFLTDIYVGLSFRNGWTMLSTETTTLPFCWWRWVPTISISLLEADNDRAQWRPWAQLLTWPPGDIGSATTVSSSSDLG